MKTLLIDYNQTVISSVHIGAKNFGSELNMSMVRHLILNSILYYRKKFPSYDNVVICCDGPNSWRQKEFSYYKAVRRKNKKESPLDWKLIYEAIDALEQELTDYFPYKVVRVDGAEGDDVIAVLVKYLNENREDLEHAQIKIISSDKDFRQLQVYPGVTQYSGIQKQDIVETEPERYLFEQILRGDSSDGVPNFLSDDDVLVRDGVRQRRLTQKRLDECWDIKDPVKFCSTEELNKYARNKKLVDLVNDQIPESIQDSIIEAYKNAPVHRKMKIMTYMTKYRLRNLLDELQYF